MTVNLEPGHRAVVVGAAGAIGAAACQSYAAAGAVVVALDLDGSAAQALAGSLPGSGHRGAGLDVTDLAAVSAAAALAGQEGISSLCYAAGIAPTFEVLNFDWAAYRRTMAVNLDGALHIAHTFGTVMVAAGHGGSMTFISSAAGKQGAAGAAAYCASKFALRGVVESFAGEVGANGIRVNAICPGEVDSPMLARVAQGQAARHGLDPAVMLGEWTAAAALRRLVQPREVADAVVWLASAHASAITGASIDITAGLGMA
jgi:NAD(P)-dependent dehydrogenase (short-subunit alcohol dehydrogenase family)